MSQHPLWAAVFEAAAVALACYAVLGALWRLRDRADRAAAALLAPAPPDPYHAVALAGRPEDIHRPAVARLLLDGSVRIDERGLLTLAPGGPHQGPEPGPAPVHPLPAAVLAALVRRDRPTSVPDLSGDTALRVARGAFLAAEDAKYPRLAEVRDRDRLADLAILLIMAVVAWYSFQLVVLSRPDTLRGIVLMGTFVLAVAVGCCGALLAAMVMVRVWPKRRDPFRAYCAALPPHPDVVALDPELLARLDHREPRPVEYDTWVDSGGAF
ncbi:hypothetical protein OHS33_07125 [Streptomyces sp. NBC_00536]|uniref:hypothetical protein n=1 Tax=Streptomyces sp. NBC_00536 TaxID=2975769 RepID=UPI002E81C060|nr:hypothetical protein [Streptomyces sp. NBC_00536]WUC78132.1 hypothetical protein OHS33_07125 [Streptomyces sp. NBC_00536]